MPIEVSPLGLEDPPDRSMDTGGAARDENLPPTTDQGAWTGVPDASQAVLIELGRSSPGGSATAGTASPREQHPDDEPGQDPIREAEELRRGDPFVLRQAAEARLDAYEAPL